MRKAVSVIVLMSLVALLSGCSGSRVVLLDSGKAHNAVVVKTKSGEMVLDKPNTYTEITSADKKPTAAKEIDPEEIKAEFGDLIS